MHISIINLVSVAKPQKFGKTGDGQDSVSKALPPPYFQMFCFHLDQPQHV